MEDDRGTVEPWSHTEVPPSIIARGPPAPTTHRGDAGAAQAHPTPSPKKHGAHPFGDDAGLDVHHMRRVAATAEKKLRPSSAGRLRPLSAASVRIFGAKHEPDVTSMSIHGYGSTVQAAALSGMSGDVTYRLVPRAHDTATSDRAAHRSPAPLEVARERPEPPLSPSRHHATGEPRLRRPLGAASLNSRVPLHVASVMLPLPSSVSSLSQAGIRLGRRTHHTQADFQQMPGESGTLSVAGSAYGTSVQASTALDSAVPPARPLRSAMSLAKKVPSAASPQRHAHSATTVGMMLEARGNGMRASRPSSARDLLRMTTASCELGGTVGTTANTGSVHVLHQPDNARADVGRKRPQSAHAQLHAAASSWYPRDPDEPATGSGRASSTNIHQAADASHWRAGRSKLAPQLAALFVDAGIDLSPLEDSSKLDDVISCADTMPIPRSLETAAAGAKPSSSSTTVPAKAPVRSDILRPSTTAGVTPPDVKACGYAAGRQPSPPTFGARNGPGAEPRTTARTVRAGSFQAAPSPPASPPHASHARSAVLSWPSATSLKANLPAAYDDWLRRSIRGPAVQMLAEGVRLGHAIAGSPKATAFQERYSLASREGPFQSSGDTLAGCVVANAVASTAPLAFAAAAASRNCSSRPPSAMARVLVPSNAKNHSPHTVDAVVEPRIRGAAFGRAAPAGHTNTRARARPLSASARLQTRIHSSGATSVGAGGSQQTDEFATVRFNPSVSFSRLLSASLDVPLSLQHVLEHAAGIFGGVPTRSGAPAPLQQSPSASSAVAHNSATTSLPLSATTTHNIRWRSSSMRRLLPSPQGRPAVSPARTDLDEPFGAGAVAARGLGQREKEAGAPSNLASKPDVPGGVLARQQQLATIALQPAVDSTDAHTRRRLSYSNSLAAGQTPFDSARNGIPPQNVQAENMHESLRLLQAALRAPMPPALDSKMDDECAIEIRGRPHAAFTTETEALLLAAVPADAEIAGLLPSACAFPSTLRRSLSPRQGGGSMMRVHDNQDVRARGTDARGVVGPKLLCPPDEGINLTGKAMTRTLRPRSAIPRLPTMGWHDHRTLGTHELPPATHERARCGSGDATVTRASAADAPTVHKRRRSTGEPAASQHLRHGASFSYLGLFDPWIPLQPFAVRRKEIDNASECHSSRTQVAGWDEYEGAASHIAEVILGMRKRAADERKLE